MYTCVCMCVSMYVCVCVCFSVINWFLLIVKNELESWRGEMGSWCQGVIGWFSGSLKVGSNWVALKRSGWGDGFTSSHRYIITITYHPVTVRSQ